MSIFGVSAIQSTSSSPIPPVTGPSVALIPGTNSISKGSSLNLPPYPGEDKDVEQGSPVYFEKFSRDILETRMLEFKSGKYTKRYIEAYIEFMVLSGMVSNLEYLEYKNELCDAQ